MSTDPLFQAFAGEQLQSGSFPSMHSHVVPFWADSRNVLFVDGGAEKMRGRSLRKAVADTVRAIAQAHIGGAAPHRTYLGSPTKLYRLDDTTLTEIGSGFSDGNWSLQPWETWLIACNDAEDPQIWKTGSTTATISDAPAGARIAIKRGRHLVLLHTDDSARDFVWSDDGDPEVFTPTASNAAGSIRMREFEDDIKAAVELGNQIAIYSSNQMQVAAYTGFPAYFTVRPAVKGVGSLGKNSVVAAGGINYGFSRHGIFRTDGVRFAYIDRPAVHDYLQDNVDFDQPDAVIAYHSQAQEEVIFYFLMNDMSSTPGGVKYNYRNNTWTILDPGSQVLAAEETIVFDTPLIGIGTDLFNQETTFDFSGSAAECYLQSKPFDFGAAMYYKNVTTWLVHADYEGSVTVKLGVKETNDDGEAITWVETQTNPYELHPNREGRYWVLRIEADGVGDWFKLGGFEVFGSVEGQVEI